MNKIEKMDAVEFRDKCVNLSHALDGLFPGQVRAGFVTDDILRIEHAGFSSGGVNQEVFVVNTIDSGVVHTKSIDYTIKTQSYDDFLEVLNE